MFIKCPGYSEEKKYRTFFTDVINSISIDNKNEFHEVIIGICSIYYGKDLNGKLSSKIIKVIEGIQKLYQDAFSNERKIQTIFQECIRVKLDAMIQISTTRNLDEMHSSSLDKVLSKNFHEFIGELPPQDRLDISLCLHQTFMSLSQIEQDKIIKLMSAFLNKGRSLNIPFSCWTEWMYLVVHLFKGSEGNLNDLVYDLSVFLQVFYLKDLSSSKQELSKNKFLNFCIKLIPKLLKSQSSDFITQLFVKVQNRILSVPQKSEEELEDIVKTIYQETSQFIKDYPVYHFPRRLYMAEPNGEIMAKNMENLAIFHIVRSIQKNSRTLFEDLILELGQFRHFLALNQGSKDTDFFGSKRIRQKLKTCFNKKNQYREYYFTLLARLEDCFSLFSQKNQIKEREDLAVFGYVYSVSFQETGKGFCVKESLKKDDKQVCLSSYHRNEMFDLIIVEHQSNTYSAQMESWMEEALQQCFLSFQDEHELIFRVGLFRYLLSHRTPYLRGSAMIGGWIEKGIYQYHQYDCEYGYPEVRKKGHPLVDLDAFSSLGLSCFLDHYCRKIHLKKIEGPSSKIDLSLVLFPLQEFIIEKYPDLHLNNTDS